MSKEKIKVYLYTRVSTTMQIDGYSLIERKLVVNEEEAVAIRTIFDQYVNTDLGANGIAKYLENHGIHKIARENGNKAIKKRKDGSNYKDFYYYGCKHRNMTRGHKCDYKKQVHEETVCLLFKLHEAKHHVNVRLDMDELDLKSARTEAERRQATYEEITKYVYKNGGYWE